MDKLTTMAEPMERPSFEETVFSEKAKKAKIGKGLLNYAGIMLGVFIMFVVVIIVTTDIRLESFEEFAVLGLDFFLLMFCSYSMYISCTDSGMRAGLVSNAYRSAVDDYLAQKKRIEDGHLQGYLYPFCRKYVQDELENVRMSILSVEGIDYEKYKALYMAKDDDVVNADGDLSSSQREAVIRANKVKPIKLTPDMIMQKGGGTGRRSPLGMKAKTKKKVQFAVKFLSTVLVAIAASIIAFDVVTEPTLVLLATCAFKLLVIAVNGFTGYKFGYENIVFDAANYTTDQADLLRQAVAFAEDAKRWESTTE